MKKNTKIIQSVGRAIEILKCFDNNEQIGVTEISKMLNLHKSTTFGLISTLEAYQFLEKDEDTGKYRLGMELYRLSTKVNSNLRRIANPYLERLVNEFEETVNLVMRDDIYVTYLEKIESPHSMRISTREGLRLPLYCTAVGKAILSTYSDDYINEVLNNTEIKKYTDKTVINENKIISNINIVRKNGYAEDFEELEEGLTCVAAPIINHTKKAVAAISVSGPTARMTEKFRQDIAKSLVKHCIEISKKMGYVSNLD